MSQRFATIGKLHAVNYPAPTTDSDGLTWCVVKDAHGNSVTFVATDPGYLPPIGTQFEIRVTECGDFYGTG